MLQEKLDAITARTRALVQPERLAFSEQVVADLLAQGMEEHILPPGAVAPEFALQDGVTGQVVRSQDLQALGPVILVFFRGRWDPYCVTALEAWRDVEGRIRETGSLLVAISPQNRRQNDFFAGQHGLRFPILSDPGCRVAEQFGLAYSVTPEARTYYQSILVNIPFANAGLNYQTATEDAWRLPLPAVYVLKAGTVLFAEAHADPRVRTEPAEVIGLYAEDLRARSCI